MDKPGPWERPYDPRSDGFDLDGFKPWNLRAGVVCMIGGLLIELLGRWG